MKRKAFTLIEALVVIGILCTLASLLLPVISGGCSQAPPHRYEVTIIRPDGSKHETIFKVSKWTVRVDTFNSNMNHWVVRASPLEEPIFHLPAGWTAKIIDHGAVVEQE